MLLFNTHVTSKDAEHVLHKCMTDYSQDHGDHEDSEGHDTDTETNSNNVSVETRVYYIGIKNIRCIQCTRYPLASK